MDPVQTRGWTGSRPDRKVSLRIVYVFEYLMGGVRWAFAISATKLRSGHRSPVCGDLAVSLLFSFCVQPRVDPGLVLSSIAVICNISHVWTGVTGANRARAALH